jgi:integrase
LGAYPAVQVSKARAARDAARAQLELGIDPMEAKKEQAAPTTKTFKQVAEEFHEIWKSGKNEEHIKRVWSRLERDAFPAIGSQLLTNIKPADIIAMVRKVEDRGAMDVSRRLKQKCGEVYGYAIAMGYTESDPTARVNKALRPKPKVQHMPMVALSEMPKLLAAIDGYQLNTVVRLALQFCLLTGTRTAEVREAQWSEIDLKARMWRVPAARMKMEREHLVPLSRQTIALLKEIATHRRGIYLFPGARRPVMNTNAMIFALYDLELRGEQTVHGFRRLFSTTLNESGRFKKDWIEMQLAHGEEDDVRGAYNAALYLDHRVPMMQWWADQLDAQRRPAAPEDDFDDLMLA